MTAAKTTVPPAPAAPGSPDFDVAGATAEEFDKHYEILARQAKLAALLPAAPTGESIAVGVPAGPAPGDIRAVRGGEERYFTDVTWALLADKQGHHDGWEISVPKPADL